MSAIAASMVDVVYPLAGDGLPRDHRQALADALERLLPWLDAHPEAGVHCINVVAGSGALVALDGARLDVAGHALRLGHPVLRELLPHGTLYAHLVATSDDDELAFQAAIERELGALGVRGRQICGRRQVVSCGAAQLTGFSLMLDGLSTDDSMQLLEAGLGRHRHLGCGVFVPHKSAAAVHA
jgi:hypothetical protein